MGFIQFGTTANQQFSVSTNVVTLSDQIVGDSNIANLFKADLVCVRINNGQPIRFFVDGGTPTDALGKKTSGGFLVSGTTIDQVKMIQDATASGSAEVTVSVAKNTPGIFQILDL